MRLLVFIVKVEVVEALVYFLFVVVTDRSLFYPQIEKKRVFWPN